MSDARFNIYAQAFIGLSKRLKQATELSENAKRCTAERLTAIDIKMRDVLADVSTLSEMLAINKVESSKELREMLTNVAIESQIIEHFMPAMLYYHTIATKLHSE